MTKKRDTQTYDLKQGRTVVYKGATNDLERREEEHKKSGKEFDKILPTSARMTEENALKKEQDQLAAYRKSHGGKNPKYNKE